MVNKTQRMRDPIHGLIVFDGENKTDMVAWQLIQTKEFQRLRRIKQLGVSEFVFPGATHTRFSHSIGVYHNARQLMKIVEREMGGMGYDFDPDRAETVLLAALLHDVGHGPFSHAFEGAREAIAYKRNVGPILKHEKFSAMMITADDGEIKPILEEHDEYNRGLAKKIAELLETDNPSDFYHAVVSSSFDADRLDYLIRDRYMTGTQAGAIDSDWLLDNLTVQTISVHQDDDDEPTEIPTFVFKNKARFAAEDFLLARYRLYSQVYLHKVTRGFEKLITELFSYIGDDTTNKTKLGVSDDHPLMRFLARGGDTLDNYRALDDFVAWGVIEQLTRCDDPYAVKLASGLWNRKPLKVLDVTSQFENKPDDLNNAIRRLNKFFNNNNNIKFFKDQVPFNLYTEVSGEDGKEHKMVRVLDGRSQSEEIDRFEDTIIGRTQREKKTLIRFYFLDTEAKSSAEEAMRG